MKIIFFNTMWNYKCYIRNYFLSKKSHVCVFFHRHCLLYPFNGVLELWWQMLRSIFMSVGVLINKKVNEKMFLCFLLSSLPHSLTFFNTFFILKIAKYINLGKTLESLVGYSFIYICTKLVRKVFSISKVLNMALIETTTWKDGFQIQNLFTK
jgi:hypothetical protein